VASTPLSDFYNAAGAGANVTPAGAIATQSVVGYSGGGVTWRVPNKTLTPFQITPPHLNAGCNGIDAYLGSFSMINKPAFVAALRNFGQQAVGYFFSLALRAVSPEIAVTLDVLNDLAQKANQFGKNSCQMAKWAVDSLGGDWLKKNGRDASDEMRRVGDAVDDFAANLGVANLGMSDLLQTRYQQMYGNNTGPQTKQDAGTTEPVEFNTMWYLLNQADGTSQMSDMEKYLMMSLVGTSGARSSRATDGMESFAPSASIDDVKTLVDGSDVVGQTLFLLECDEPVACLWPRLVPETDMSFRQAAQSLSDAIQQGVLNRSAPSLTPIQKSVLQLSSVPIYRASALSASGSMLGSAAEGLRRDLIDYAAVDAAVQLINYYTTMSYRALGTTSGVPKPILAEGRELQKRIKWVRDNAYTYAMEFYKAHGDPGQKVEQLNAIERAMYTNLNLRLAANANFAHR
jgi:hypothetical protein